MAYALFPTHPDSACSLCGVPLPQPTAYDVKGTELCLTAVRIVVWTLESPTSVLIHHLKEFLLTLSMPLCIRQVLLQGILQLAEKQPAACREALQYAEVFLPELDLKQAVQEAVIQFLQTGNFVLHQDYEFDATGQLQLSDQATIALFAELSAGDRLLVTELLGV